MVKHVVKCEKWACLTLKVGKNKPIYYVMKTRDFKRFCEEIKEKSEILRLPILGLSDKLTNLVLRCLFWQFLTVQESAKRANAMAFAKFRVVKFK